VDINDDTFDDDSFLDDDEMADYNIGYATGKEYERERILKVLEEKLGEIDWDELVSLIKKD
jgi:hypothetical protein